MATLKLKARPATPSEVSARKRPPVRGRGSVAPPRPKRAQPMAQPALPPRATPQAQPRSTSPAQRRADPRLRHAEPRGAAGAPTSAHEPGSMRLSKRMSELGLASRRDADDWIAKGWVRVDGRVVSRLGARVMRSQRVEIDARAAGLQARQVTVLLNKPIGYVSGQAEDGYEPAYVLITPQNHWRDDASGMRFHPEQLRHLVPAGRLDIDSVGLLVLTQDGRVAKQLIGAHSEVEKEYLVRVQQPQVGPLGAAGLAQLNHGLSLDGEALSPARVEWVNDDQLRFVLKQGKKRQIRRMCEAVGLKVLSLKRVRIGKVVLGDLPAGQWRYLAAGESFA